MLDKNVCPIYATMLLHTAVAALSLTIGVQLNIRSGEAVDENTPVLTRMYLQLHAC